MKAARSDYWALALLISILAAVLFGIGLGAYQRSQIKQQCLPERHIERSDK